MAEPFRNLAWDDLRLVRAIAEARSLPAAADRLGINHSTVFRRLGSIESVLGVALFERHRTGYALTAAGEEVAALASRISDDVTAVTRRLAGHEVTPRGEVRVTTNDSLLIHLLTPIFATFRAAFPQVQLDIVLGNQALNLSRRDADVAIRATDHPPDALVGRRAARIAWALYGRAEDFPPDVPITPEALAGRDWVSLGDGMGSLAAVRHVQAHVAPERVAYRVNSVLGLGEAVEAGLGIGHLPCFVADQMPTLARLSPLNEEMATDLWILTHPDLRQSARVRAFLDHIASEIGRHRPLIEGARRAERGVGIEA